MLGNYLNTNMEILPVLLQFLHSHTYTPGIWQDSFQHQQIGRLYSLFYTYKFHFPILYESDSYAQLASYNSDILELLMSYNI